MPHVNRNNSETQEGMLYKISIELELRFYSMDGAVFDENICCTLML